MWEKKLILILILCVGCQSFHSLIDGEQLLGLPGEWLWVVFVGGVTSVGQEGVHHLAWGNSEVVALCLYVLCMSIFHIPDQIFVI